ncbi:uncharacterized protein LOC134795088 isoform X2 [Cydia splendana]|uniref:uncharacterized protein LOC134795088 isoform X2 n=1 Tax=Cydia splendana TaxID=1100963 RepID=UPI00300CD5FE
MSSSKPYVTITEQPAGKSQRFRYLSEVDGARSVGSIPGVSSTAERRTYPTIRVHGNKGPFVVLLSLLNPHNNLVHPHSITGSDPRYTCRHGVIFVISDEAEVVFKNIGILCVKGKTEKDVKSALKSRKEMNIDPFGAGFSHIYDHRQINFTAVRLCFQVFLPGPNWTPADRMDLLKYDRSLAPIASDVVYDAKKLNDLKIVHVTSIAGPLTGGAEMTLLCDKYTGQNPDVVFDDGRGWSQTAPAQIYHKQLAIVFKAPPYREERDPRSPDYLQVKVYLQQCSERGVLRSQPATVKYIFPEKNSQLQFPKPTQLEMPRISLKQIRMHRQSPGSPEDGHQKRGRNSKEDLITSQSDVKSDHTASYQADVGGRADAIPLFDPQNPELLTQEWISNIDLLGFKYNWSDTVKAFYMQKRLTGIAKDWLSSIRHSDSLTWPEWKNKLLEAFPPRRVSYLDLLYRRSKMIIEDKSKIKANSVHEMNAKRAYACLIDGRPLQMKTPAHWDHYDNGYYTQHSLHPNYLYLADREDSRNNGPQIRPINLNKADHKFGMSRYDAISPDEERRGPCCCNDDKACMLSRCSTIRQNEMRPSCIIQRNQIPVDRSWHQPCSTLTSSSSSPSIANPAPDYSNDQDSREPKNLTV